MVAVRDDEDRADDELPALPEPDLAEADGNERNDHRIQFVRTGLVRVWIDGSLYRLRRPFFGEFKTLRLDLEDVIDRIQEASSEAQLVAAKVMREQRDWSPEDDPEATVEKQRDWRKQNRAATRALNSEAEDARRTWWLKVFEVLSLDGIPNDFPAWVNDPTLASEIVTHWRTAPLGRG